MIMDKLSNAALYAGANARLAKAFEYLRKTDFTRIEPGRYAIEGEKVFALVQHPTTRPAQGAEFEAHRKFIDVQFLFEGIERMGYAHLASLKVTKPYIAEKDCEMLVGNGDFVTVPAGFFVVFFPEDAHMPCVAIDNPAPVKKVVVKVAVD